MKTIKTQFPNHIILFIISGIILILLTISGFFYYNYESKSIRNDKYSELSAIAELKINQILQWKQERLGDAVVLTESPAFNWKNPQIMNLAAKARDAMLEHGGMLKVELKNFTIDKSSKDSELQPGKYVKLMISYTGKGIDKSLIE